MIKNKDLKDSLIIYKPNLTAKNMLNYLVIFLI